MGTRSDHIFCNRCSNTRRTPKFIQFPQNDMSRRFFRYFRDPILIIKGSFALQSRQTKRIDIRDWVSVYEGKTVEGLAFNYLPRMISRFKNRFKSGW